MLDGQTPAGGWGYTAPDVSGDESQRLRTLIEQRAELKTVPGPSDGPRPPPSPEIVERLKRIEQKRLAPDASGGPRAATLVPRPDTETVVELALEIFRERQASRQMRIADIGTGSGAILLALLHEIPGAVGVGTDLSLTALKTAFAELSRRQGDYALCGVAAVAERDEGGQVRLALAFLGMGPVPLRLDLPPMSREALSNGALEEAVGDLTRDRLQPLDDLQASKEYRMWLARRLGARAVRRAAGAAEVVT